MIIKVSVRPGSKGEKIEKISDGEYRVYVMERAEKGKANTALAKLLAGYFNISWRDIRIKNPTSRKKIVDIGL